jgi:predicted HAD superfamily Cof-like phosphohydrolase
MNSYNYICTQVAEFNYLFGVITHNYPNNDNIIIDRFNSFSTEFNKTQVKLRFGLINEEINELKQAITDKNPIEIIDALCDILYVVAGAKVYFNFKIDDKIINQLEKYYTPNNFFIYDNDTLQYIINSIEEINNIFNKMLSLNDVLSDLTQTFINNYNVRYHSIFLNHLIKYYNKTLDELVINVFNISYKCNIDIIKLFDIVHNSNMTKVCELESDAVDTVKWYKINEPRYTSPSFKEIIFNDKKYYVIYDIETNKILKSIKYIPAKFI